MAVKPSQFPQSDLQNKLSEIRNTLRQLPVGGADISLIGGETGRALFFLNHYLLTDEIDDLQHFANILASINNRIQKDKTDGSLSRGVTGFAWLLKNVQKLEVLELENEKVIFELLNQRITKFVEDCVERGHWDYLHGSLGCSLYLFSSVDEYNNRQMIKYILANLEALAIYESGKYYWTTSPEYLQYFPQMAINLGAAHGIAGVLRFLSYCVKYNVDAAKARKLISGIITLLKHEKQDFSEIGSCYPNSLNYPGSVKKSRLAWCYGDLGIAYNMLSASAILEDKHLREISIEILDSQLNRKDLRRESILDAGLCHGTAGIAFIFLNIYKATRLARFKKAADFWYLQTLNMSKFNDGFAGFKTVKLVDETYYINSETFLEGVAGIGLSMMARLSNKLVNWSEVLITNC